MRASREGLADSAAVCARAAVEPASPISNVDTTMRKTFGDFMTPPPDLSGAISSRTPKSYRLIRAECTPEAPADRPKTVETAWGQADPSPRTSPIEHVIPDLRHGVHGPRPVGMHGHGVVVKR